MHRIPLALFLWFRVNKITAVSLLKSVKTCFFILRKNNLWMIIFQIVLRAGRPTYYYVGNIIIMFSSESLEIKNSSNGDRRNLIISSKRFFHKKAIIFVFWKHYKLIMKKPCETVIDGKWSFGVRLISINKKHDVV